MTTARSGPTETLLADGTVLITGGSSGSSFLALTAAPAGCGPAGQVSQNTAEIYNPVADTFTATASIPACPIGDETCSVNSGDALPGICPVSATVAIAASPTGATESGTTVTITTTATNNFITGQLVQVASVAVAGYNGTFTVSGPAAAGMPNGTTFTYTDSTSGLAASGGGAASSDVAERQCGLVDSSAVLLGPGAMVPNGVLVAGGDYVEFLGNASTQAFVYEDLGIGSGAWAPASPMNEPRELAGIRVLPSGDVLLAGGVDAASGTCPTDSGDVTFTTNTTGEIFNPATFSWTLITAPMSVARVATIEQFSSGALAGTSILAGGVDAETTNGAGDDNFPTCEPVTNIAQTTQSETDLFVEDVGTPASSTFTPATGALTQDRAAYGAAILTSGSFSGDLAVFGGDCGNGTLASAPIDSSSASTLCSNGGLPYMELFNPGTQLWTTDTSSAAPTTPAAGPASALLP